MTYMDYEGAIVFSEEDGLLLDNAAKDAGLVLDSAVVQLEKNWAGHLEIVTVCYFIKDKGVVTNDDLSKFHDEWMKRFGPKEWQLCVTGDRLSYDKAVAKGVVIDAVTVKERGIVLYA